MNTPLFLKKRKRGHGTLNEIEEHEAGSLYEDSFFRSRKTSFYKVTPDFKIVENHNVGKHRTKKKSNGNNLLLAKSLNIGYYLITPLLLGVFFGYWIDSFLRTKPAFLLVFLILGIVSSFYNLWKLTQENGN